MDQYKFEIRTPVHISMTESLPFPSVTDARAHAAERIGHMLYAHAHRAWQDANWRVDVTDKDGSILWVFEVAAAKVASESEQ